MNTSTFSLPASLAAWDGPDFAATLKHELAALGPGVLPLQQALTASSYALDEPVTISVIASRVEADHLLVRIGVFFQGIIAGCNCADDPTPVEALNEYAEMDVRIDRASALAQVSLTNPD